MATKLSTGRGGEGGRGGVSMQKFMSPSSLCVCVLLLLLLLFKEICYAQYRVNGAFVSPKSIFFSFLLFVH